MDDLKFAQNAKRIEGNFTHDVLIAIDETVVEGNQVILFQNRRGFARYVSCQVCDYIPKCIRCDVSLTQHLLVQKLRCHYCGYEEIMPTFCGQCGSEEIQSVGFGTERLEEELHFLRPGLSISRMDLDTTR
jgi:primosomal protein N' (replication factor Y)